MYNFKKQVSTPRARKMDFMVDFNQRTLLPDKVFSNTRVVLSSSGKIDCGVPYFVGMAFELKRNQTGEFIF